MPTLNDAHIARFVWQDGDLEFHDQPLAKALRAGDLVTARKQTYGSDVVGHRPRTDTEVRAAVDFATIQKEWQDATSKLIAKWPSVKAQQVESLVTQIEAAVNADSVTALANLAAPVMGADVIGDHMVSVAKSALDAALTEATTQGATITPVDIAALEPALRSRADAVATMMARSLSDAASRQAFNRYGTGTSGLSAQDVAQGVKSHLDQLGDTYLEDQLGGALTQAQNTGRRAVMSQGDAQVYASELLDLNTCDPCSEKDGTQYDSLADAEQDYPAGGYSDCDGGPRCRGTLVAVYNTEEPSTDEGEQ